MAAGDQTNKHFSLQACHQKLIKQRLRPTPVKLISVHERKKEKTDQATIRQTW